MLYVYGIPYRGDLKDLGMYTRAKKRKRVIKDLGFISECYLFSKSRVAESGFTDQFEGMHRKLLS